MKRPIYEPLLLPLLPLVLACSGKTATSLGDDRSASGNQPQTTASTQCTAIALPEVSAGEPGIASEWLALPGFGPVLRASPTGSAIVLLSPTSVVRVDLEAHAYCELSGLPQGELRDLRTVAGNRLLLSVAPPESPARLYASDDVGTTWKPAGDLGDSIGERGPSRITFDAASSSIYAFDLGDLALRSVDGGDTWATVVASSENFSLSGGVAIDRGGALILAGRNGGTGGCSLRTLDVSNADSAWHAGSLELTLPCSGIVTDPATDAAFYVFGATGVSHVIIDGTGSAIVDGTLADVQLVVNDLWADAAAPGHVRFTGINGEGVALYDAKNLATPAAISVEGGADLIGGALLALPGTDRLSVWAFAPSSSTRQTKGFLLGTE